MITMLSYVLFSYSVFDFPIHTLRLLHSLALASQLTLYAFLHSLSPASQLTLPLASLCLFPSYRARVPKTPVARVTQAFSTKLFTRKDRRHIDVPDDTAALATLFIVQPIS